MKYKHIVFDIDGTLIDTEYAVLHSLQETIKESVSYTHLDVYKRQVLTQSGTSRMTKGMR